MPIPEHHLRRLDENLSAQENWLANLQRHIAGLQDEASAYEVMLALGRDQDLLHVLEELHDQPELFEQVADDPRAFLERRGVRLPEDAAVTVKAVTVNRHQPRYAVEARFVRETLTFGVGWSPRAAFYLLTEPLRADGAAEEES
jgi:hypothetical protein